jgi:recombination protein RecT
MATSNATNQAMTPAANGSAPIQEAPKYANTLHAFLERQDVKAKLAEVAAKFMKPDDLIRLALMAASRSPDLLKCSPESVLRCLMDAAAMGIVPGGTNGRGYLIPRANKHTKKLEATFDPGWRGFEDIARRTGKVARFDAHAVYDQDEYQVTLGDNPTLTHVPNYDVEDRGAIVAGYAIAIYVDGAKQIEPLSKKDIAKIRAASPASGTTAGPWANWEEEMVRKSAIRRLCKHLPVYDPVMEQALAMTADGDFDDRPALPSAMTPGDTASLEAALMGGGAHDPATGELVETKPETAS